MRNIQELLSDTRKWRNLTGTDIAKNSEQVMLYDWKVVEAMDVEGDVFRDVVVKARSKRDTKRNIYGPVRKVEMRFYGDDQTTTKAWVSCSCEYFLYTAEVALYNKDSSDIRYSNGADPNIRNPQQIPIICKHIYAALKSGAVKRPITKSLVKDQLKYQKEKEKEKLKKEKEKAEKKEKEAKRKQVEKERLEKQKIQKEKKKQEEVDKRKKEQERLKALREKERAKREKVKK